MTAVLVIFLLSCGGLLLLVFCKPAVSVRGRRVSIFWTAPLAGALCMILTGQISPGEVAEGLTGAGEVNPLKILVLFFSMTMMSVYLDELGFFRLLAVRILRRAGGSQRMLFFLLYGLVSVLTVFTSNDIIVLTFTPFICHFAASARIDPVPYLVSEFVAANTWSMALIIGQPDQHIPDERRGHILLAVYAADASADGVGRSRVLRRPVPAVPAAVARPAGRAGRVAPAHRPSDRDHRLCHLGGCILLLSVSSFLNLPMWLITCCFFGSLVLFTMGISFFRHRAPYLIGRCFVRAPWDLAPFVLSMFVLVLALEKHGVTAALGDVLTSPRTVAGMLLSFGGSSFLAANLVNNIPMSVLYRSVISALPAGTGNGTAALYAAVVGSNLGAFFTPMGALAGIMWTGQLRDHGVPFSFGSFVRYGAAVAIPALTAALLGLWIVL